MPQPSQRTPTAEKMARHHAGVKTQLVEINQKLDQIAAEVRAVLHVQRDQQQDERRAS